MIIGWLILPTWIVDLYSKSGYYFGLLTHEDPKGLVDVYLTWMVDFCCSIGHAVHTCGDFVSDSPIKIRHQNKPRLLLD